jgi:hypothetical protein
LSLFFVLLSTACVCLWRVDILTVGMSRRIYLVLLLLLVAVAATGVYLRQRAQANAARAANANCDTPAPPPPPANPPPKLPGFAVEAACGAATEAPKAAVKKK